MKKPIALLGLLPLFILLAACGGPSNTNDGKTHVVAAFYPFAYIAEQVGGSFVDVQNLTSPGVEPHDLELKPKQVGAVLDADLVIFETGFQAAVDQAVKQANLSDRKKVDVSRLVTLKKTADELADQKAHGDVVEHNDEQDASRVDPHVWLDPVNMLKISRAVVSKLSAIDPAHADAYAANGAAFDTKLTALDSSFRRGLANCQRRQVVTSHAAFAYLAQRYGLQQVSIAGIDPNNEPSGSQLADIIELVERHHITTVFTEDLVSPRIADTIARDAKVRTATLSPIEGLTDKTEHDTYLTLMQQNLAAIQKANGCS
ncbi:MAG: zinc transport system substrate-binding protein [Nocardioidaceae bacterium]|nr:zinc transport system substrate-binding protein [Nocardioidaceae bacterium]